MRYVGAAYRAINPKWSFGPLSGQGAAIHGGRFNPKGVPALYLGTTLEVAFIEATQGFAFKFHPLTMCSYEIDCADLVDLRDRALAKSAGVSSKAMASPWADELARNQRPESWTLYDRFHGDRAGILVPSLAIGAAPGMCNLVLWNWSTKLPHKVTLFDPDHRLPRNQRSWAQ